MSATLIALIAAFSSCTDKDLFDLIPADIDYIAAADVESVISTSGFEITENGITGPSDLKSEINSIPADVQDFIISLHSAIDTRKIMMFGYAAMQNGDPEFYFLAKITDSKVLEDMFGKTGVESLSGADGFKINRIEHTYLLQADGFLWALTAHDSQAATDRVKKIIERAADKNITSNNRIYGILSERNALNVVVNLTPFVDLTLKYGYQVMDTQTALMAASVLPGLRDNWLSATLSYSATEAELVAKIFNPESGKNLRLPLLQQIDSKSLYRIPDDALMAVAVGIENSALCNLIDAVKPMIDRNPAAAMALTQLRKIDGTAGAAVTARNPRALIFNNDISQANTTAFFGTQPGAAQDMADFISNFIAPSVQTHADGNTVLLSSSPELKCGNSRLVKMMEGKELALAGEIPSFSQLTDGRSDIGAKAALTYKDGELRVLIAFSNLKGSMIAELIKLTNSLECNSSRHRHEPLSETDR